MHKLYNSIPRAIGDFDANTMHGMGHRIRNKLSSDSLHKGMERVKHSIPDSIGGSLHRSIERVRRKNRHSIGGSSKSLEITDFTEDYLKNNGQVSLSKSTGDLKGSRPTVTFAEETEEFYPNEKGREEQLSYDNFLQLNFSEGNPLIETLDSDEDLQPRAVADNETERTAANSKPRSILKRSVSMDCTKKEGLESQVYPIAALEKAIADQSAEVRRDAVKLAPSPKKRVLARSASLERGYEGIQKPF